MDLWIPIFVSPFVSSDKPGEFQNCRQVLEELCLNYIRDQDCKDVRYICEVVSKRAAQLAAAGVACLLNKVGYYAMYCS